MAASSDGVVEDSSHNSTSTRHDGDHDDDGHHQHHHQQHEHWEAPLLCLDHVAMEEASLYLLDAVDGTCG